MHFDKLKIQIVSLLLFFICQLSAQDSNIIPGPLPFSLDSESAIDCIELLRRNRFIEVHDENGSSDVIKVETVWSFFLNRDENYPEGHQLRYDIILNGEPLDWDNSFIEYGGDMINLRLLFLYRNQYPPQGLKYIISN